MDKKFERLIKKFEKETRRARCLSEWKDIIKKYYSRYGKRILYYADCTCPWDTDAIARPLDTEDCDTIGVAIYNETADNDILQENLVCFIYFAPEADCEYLHEESITTNERYIQSGHIKAFKKEPKIYPSCVENIAQCMMVNGIR